MWLNSVKQKQVLHYLFLVFLVAFSFAHLVEKAIAQIEPPDREFIFFEDKSKKKDEKKRRKAFQEKQKKLRAKQQKELPFDINAPNINFDSAGNKVQADGGLLIAYGPTIMEAERGTFDVKTHDAELSGSVRITDLTGNLLADSVLLNLDTGAGRLSNTEMYFEEGGYRVWAETTDKSAAEDYKFEEARLTTCSCPDDENCRPWSIQGSDAKISRNGYGQVWNARLAVSDVPVFYTPYLIFPAKTDRQTGLLPATFGNGSRHGFEMLQPLFINIDRSTDATITGILQTKTRVGAETEFRKLFSADHRLEMGVTFLDETKRDGELQGTVTDGLADPELKEHRAAGYLDYIYSQDVGGRPVQVIAKGGFVNDDLIIREFEQPNIAPYNSRFVESRAVIRRDFFDSYSGELSTEYNQAMVDNDEVLFQQLPTADLVGLHVYRPFGENPLGAKVVWQNGFNSTNFYREEGYDGQRHEAFEELRLPFHIRNYMDAEVSTDLRGSLYQLDETRDVTANGADLTFGDSLPSSSDRLVPGLGLKTSTILERVFETKDDNWFKRIAELGASGRNQQLARVKHTVEPKIKYRYVPEVDQDENPQFDSIDRLAKKSLVTYELTQRLYARYEPRNQYVYGIEETAPEVGDVAGLQNTGPVDEQLAFGLQEDAGDTFRAIERGARKELVNLKLSQSYDFTDQTDESLDDDLDELDGEDLDGDGFDDDLLNDQNVSSFSDLGALLELLPNEYIRLRTGTNFDFDQNDFSSYSIEAQLLNKRGDELRSRLTFIEPTVRQLEAGVQAVLTDRLKLGYYTRFDDLEGEFIENRVGMRLKSACNCWVFDLEYAEKINPDESNFLATITLVGLGEITNKFLGDQLTQENDSTTQ